MRYLLFTILIYISQFSLANNSNYYFEKISPGSGFAYNEISTITEDSNGMIWFGCSNGLYYYNTSSIEKINLPVDSAFFIHKINKVYTDQNNNIWVCTQNGLFKKDKYDNSFLKVDLQKHKGKSTKSIIQVSTKSYYIVIDGKLFCLSEEGQNINEVKLAPGLKSEISFLDIDNTGNIIVGTLDGCFYMEQQHPKKLLLFYKSSNNQIKTICHDNVQYYIGYDNEGVTVINNKGKELYKLNKDSSGKHQLPDNRIRDIIKTKSGEIWIGTFKGIKIINSKKSVTITSSINTGLPFNSIYDFYKGNNGGIWIGTWAGGLAYYKDINYRFRHIQKVPNEKTELQSIISSFTQDLDGNILIGSEQSGINILSSNNNDFLPTPRVLVNNQLSGIKSFATDNGENIYIGTIFQGIWHYNSKHKTLNKINKNAALDSSVISTMAYTKGELWVASRSEQIGLSKYDFTKKRFSYHSYNSSNVHKIKFINKLMFDLEDRLWVCTEDGLFFKNKDEDKLIPYTDKDSVSHFKNTWIYYIFQDNEGFYWAGTKGKGVYRFSIQTGNINHINSNIKLGNADIYGIAQDKNKNIWLSTNKGIYSYDYSLKKATHFSSIDGTSGELYNPNAIICNEQGKMFFGSANGLCFIDPKHIKTNMYQPKVFLSKLLINNKPLNKKNHIISNSQVIGEIKKITLNHNQNSLTFNVVSNNFIKPEKNIFKYRLINYQNEWIETTHNKDITFTKIPPGKYKLEIVGSNNDKIWAKSPLTIDINVLAPIWIRWYALLLYLTLTLFLIILIWKELNLKIRLRKEILSEKYKREANKEIYDEKLRFFTNISHEIRTPLTLVVSPLNSLLNKYKDDNNTSKHLNIIKRNSLRLLRLTNQLLDFRLLEVGKLNANFSKTNIVQICMDVLQCFEHLANEKKINLIFNSCCKSVWISADPDMIEKIIYNLIANALKFSNTGSQVFLSIENKDLTGESYSYCVFRGKQIKGKCIEIKVRDFGIGIKKELLPTIFDRFTVDPNEKETGTGIGLHLCQEYARLNNGNLLITSTEGKGSSFILNLPYQKNSEFIRKNIVSDFSKNHTIEHIQVEEINTTPGYNKKVILLTEDNDDLRSYLKEFLSNYYKVITSKNGQQAFEIANEIIPDLVITDILMPFIDGIELTKKMKENKVTSNIPIIVLTALSDSKYQKESLLQGIDSYLTKPIDESLLLAQINNIFNKINKLTKSQKEVKNNHLDYNTKDTPLIERLSSIIESNLRNSDFRLENVLEELNISKSTLHRKIKAISNQSPTEFVRDIRLKNAVKLMKVQKYNIDEIGSLVGFNSTSYFIRSFKKKYGTTPKEYRTKIKEAQKHLENKTT